MTTDTDDMQDEIRSPAEIACRSLCLFAMTGFAAGADRREVLLWISNNNLLTWLTPREIELIENPVPPAKQMNDMLWQCERLIILLWSLRLVDQLPAPHEECDPSRFGTDLPPIADVSVEHFIRHAKTRPDEQLWAMCDEILGLHWGGREAKRSGRMPSRAIGIEIIQERHHAINWVTGYGSLPWDEVMTDTWRPGFASRSDPS